MGIGRLVVLRNYANVWATSFDVESDVLGELAVNEIVMLLERVKNPKEQVFTEHGPVYCDMFKVVTRFGVGYMNEENFE